MSFRSRIVRTLLLAACIAFSSVHAAQADPRPFDIRSQDLGSALSEFARQSGQEILFAPELVAGKVSVALRGTLEPLDALKALLEGTGLTFRRTPGGAILIDRPDPASSSSAVPANAPPSAYLDSERAASGAAVETAEDAAAIRLGEILVTGSHISGAEQGAAPLIKITREDIRRSGYATVDQLIESLPQNFGAGASQDTIGTDSSVGNNGFGNAINLRGLGPGTTLVLVNGRRITGAGNSGQFVDVSMIPLSAVERVEVLTDGASAIYGSDAVGGVVNFILREDYDSAESTLRAGQVTDGDLSEYQFAQSLGGDWGGGGAMLAYEYYEREPLDARDREFAASSPSPRWLLPDQQRHSAFANLRQAVGESWSVFADLLYSERDAANRNAFLNLRVLEEVSNEQALGTLGVDIELGGSWIGQLYTTYSEYTFDARREQTPVATGIPTVTTTQVDTDLWSVEALANGVLAALPGGDVRAAVGGQFRQENVRTIFGDDIPERHVSAAFAEVLVPLVGSANRRAGLEALELTVAGRYEKYSDFGSDITPKVGLRWQPAPSWNVRATYGESFKAPSLAQLAPGTESLLAFIASDFGLVVPGDPLILLRTQTAQPELHEEESTSWTAGIDFQPQSSAAQMSLTYFDIDYEGRIDTPIGAGFDEFFTSPGVYGDFIVENPDEAFVNARLAAASSFTDLTGGAFSPNAVGLWADVVQTNIAAEHQSGVDLVVSYPLAVSSGMLTFALNGTYLISFDKRVAPLADSREALNLLNEPIDLRLRGGVSWSATGLSAVLWVNYQDEYRNTDVESSPIPSWTTVDGQVRYEFGARGGDLLDGLSVALSVQNLFDEDPPFVASQGSPIAHPGYDSVNATPLNRFVALEIAKRW